MKYYGTLELPKQHRWFDGAFEMENHSFCVFSSKDSIEFIETNIPLAERHIRMEPKDFCPVGAFKYLLILYMKKQVSVSIDMLTNIWFCYSQLTSKFLFVFFSQEFPFAYVLMSHKTEACYVDVFKHLDENILKKLRLIHRQLWTNDSKYTGQIVSHVKQNGAFWSCGAVKENTWQTNCVID